MLKFIPGHLKIKKICGHEVKELPYLWKYVPDQYKTGKICDKEMCDEAADRCIFVFEFDSTPDQYKTQEICDRVVSEDRVLIAYCSDTDKTQRMCDQAADYSLAPLKLILDWFVTSKMIKELYTPLYADEDILYFNDDSGNFVFSCNEMGILNIWLIILILITTLMKMILILLFLSDFWLIKFEKCK